MSKFDRITIVGLGLIGGSLGMAIKRHRLASEVIGYSRKPSTLRMAKRLRAIDTGTTDLRRAVQGTDVVILATPIDAIVSVAKCAAAAMPVGAILTDVGSSKGQIVKALEGALPRRVAFIGGHPLAGSEQRGLEASCADLFDGSLCVLTATSRTNRRALHAVKRLWSSVCGRVVVMSPQRHDRLLAMMSHLPHLIAYSLVAAASPDELPLAPRSFREVTRIANSDPKLWDDIFVSNRAALLAAMNRFERHWRTLRAPLKRSDRAALRRLLSAAQRKRHAIKDP